MCSKPSHCCEACRYWTRGYNDGRFGACALAVGYFAMGYAAPAVGKALQLWVVPAHLRGAPWSDGATAAADYCEYGYEPRT